MFRRLLLGLLVLAIIIVLAIVWLVGTTSGARQVAALAQQFVPELAVSIDSGSLWEGLTLSALRYRQPGVTVSLDEAQLLWRPQCLFEGEVCVSRIAARGTDVAINTTAMPTGTPPEPAEEGGGPIVVPLRIEVEKIDIQDSHVEFDGQQISLAQLAGGLSFVGSDLRVRPTELHGLRIRLPASETAANAEAQSDAAGRGGGRPPADFQVQLPEVSLPLAVHIDRLLLADAELAQGKQHWPLKRLVLEGEVADGHVALSKFSAEAPQGEVQLSGKVDLGGDWPLSLQLDAQTGLLPGGQPQSLALSAEGSLADLSVDVQAAGAVKAHLQAGAKLFTEGIPWHLRLAAPKLSWPLTGEPTATVSGLDGRAKGNLSTWQASVSTAINGPVIPEGKWRAKAKGDSGHAEIKQLAGELLGGTLAIDGRVGWQDGLEWQANVIAKGLKPGAYREDLSGQLGGRLTSEGAMTPAGMRLAVEVPGIEGTLRGYPLALKGSVTHDTHGVWRFDGLRLRTGPNNVALDGQLGDNWDAVAKLDLPKLAALWPGLGGQLDGELRLSGPLATPSVAGEIDGRDVAYQDTNVARLSLKTDVTALLRQASEVRLTADGIQQADQSMGDARIEFTGTLADHRLKASLAGNAPATGELTVTGGLTPETGAWSGSLAAGRLDLPDGVWRLRSATSLAWVPSAQEARLGAHCWARSSASFCLTKPLAAGPGGASVDAEVREFALSDLQPWLPPGLGWAAKLSATARVRWSGQGLPQAKVEVSTTPGRITVAPEQAADSLTLDYQTLGLTANLEPDQARLNVRLDSEQLGSASIEATLNPQAEGQPVDGQVRIEGVALAPLQAFLPQLRELEGVVSVEGAISGRLRAPAFDGELRLREGLVGVEGVPIPLQAIELTAKVDGTRARLTGGFRSGDGSARLGGSVSWSDGVHANVALAGDRLDIDYPPLVKLAVSPAITVNYDGQSLAVNGRLSVPQGRITLSELPTQAVSVSKDVVVVNKPDNGKGADGQAGEGGDGQGGGLELNTNIYLVLGDDVRFQGLGVDTGLTGALQLRQIGTGGAEAFGEVSLEDGTFKRFGQRLEVRKGRFIFAGPLSEPQIELEAVRHAGDVVAGLRVEGSPSSLQASVFSEPSLPQADALTYLITGRGPGEGSSPSEEALVTQAALGLGMLGGGRVGASLAEQLGVKDFQLESSGSGENTEVGVSGYIAPNLLVKYGVGVFSPQNTLTLRYYLTQRLYLEAVSGVANAMDVYYSFDF